MKIYKTGLQYCMCRACICNSLFTCVFMLLSGTGIQLLSPLSSLQSSTCTRTVSLTVDEAIHFHVYAIRQMALSLSFIAVCYRERVHDLYLRTLHTT